MVSVTGYSNSIKNTDSFHIKHHISCKKEIGDSSSQLLIEESGNENETEDGFEIQAFFLPFLISYVNFDSFIVPTQPVTPVIEKIINPIYISVCNFRI